MHPRDESQFGRRLQVVSDSSLGRLLGSVLGAATKAVAPYHKWCKVAATPNTNLCGADAPICSLIANYAERAMKKGGVEIDDAREFEDTLTDILEGPIENCKLCRKIEAKIALDKEAKTLSGEIVIPCKNHGCLDWSFEIGKGASEKETPDEDC